MMPGDLNSIRERFEAGLILDGGLATELERHGFDLRDPLWSARFLLENPEAIQSVHRDYLNAGADVLTTASYQATLPGLQAKGLSQADAAALLRQSVELVRKVIIESHRPETWIAASAGPYGAYLADGSEFRGDYSLSAEQLYDFHAPRLEVLADAQPTLIACETIPLLREANAIARWVESSKVPAWISFSCRDESSTCGGDLIQDCADFVDSVESIVAIGVNCTAPHLITTLVERIRERTTKLIVVYPNSGQRWDATTRSWTGSADINSFVELAKEWRTVGAHGIGGCCQTTPSHIQQLAKALKK
jgi:homocysteine S-methyltransferase